MRFQLIHNGLYYFNAVDKESSVLLLNRVSENCEGFMWRDFEGAQEDRRAMYLLGFPSDQDFENMVR